MLEGKCKLLPVPKHTHYRPAVTAFDILSACGSTCGAKGHDSQTDPLDAPLSIAYGRNANKGRNFPP